MRHSRHRVDRACDICRRRKERCDGARPTCGGCYSANRDCFYSDQTKRRGLPEGWLRALEKIWAVATIQHPDLEESVLATLNDGIRDPSQNDFAAFWTDEANENGLLKRWKRSRVSNELEHLLPSLENLPQGKLRDATTTNALLSQQETRIPIAPPQSYNVQLSHPPSNDFDLEVTSTTTHPPEIAPTQPDLTQPSHASAAIKLPPNAFALLDSYFTWTHYWLPVVEKHTLYRAWHEALESNLDDSSGVQACLLTITTFERMRRQPQDSQNTVGLFDNDGAAGVIGHLMESLVPKQVRHAKFAHIQSLLILSLAAMGAGQCHDAWVIIGKCSRMAQLLMASTKHNHSLFDTQETSSPPERLLHVLFATFVVDSILSAKLGLRPHIRPEDLKGTEFLEEDGVDEWTPCPQGFDLHRVNSGPAFAISTFNRVVQIVSFWSRIVWDDSPGANDLRDIALLENEIQHWEDAQTPRVRLKEAAKPESVGMAPHQLSVHFIHLSALMALNLRRSQLGQSERRCSDQFSVHIKQLGWIINHHTTNLNAHAIPILWEPLLDVILDQMDQAKQMLPPGVYRRTLQTLEILVAKARTTWPAFERLHLRITSQLSTTSESSLHNRTSSPRVAVLGHIMASEPTALDASQHQITTGVFATDPNIISRSDDVVPSSIEGNGISMDEAAAAPEFLMHGFDNAEASHAGNMSDADSSIPDFLTMDALQW